MAARRQPHASGTQQARANLAVVRLLPAVQLVPFFPLDGAPTQSKAAHRQAAAAPRRGRAATAGSACATRGELEGMRLHPCGATHVSCKLSATITLLASAEPVAVGGAQLQTKQMSAEASVRAVGHCAPSLAGGFTSCGSCAGAQQSFGCRLIGSSMTPVPASMRTQPTRLQGASPSARSSTLPCALWRLHEPSCGHGAMRGVHIMQRKAIRPLDAPQIPHRHAIQLERQTSAALGGQCGGGGVQHGDPRTRAQTALPFRLLQAPFYWRRLCCPLPRCRGTHRLGRCTCEWPFSSRSPLRLTVIGQSSLRRAAAGRQLSACALPVRTWPPSPLARRQVCMHVRVDGCCIAPAHPERGSGRRLCVRSGSRAFGRRIWVWIRRARARCTHQWGILLWCTRFSGCICCTTGGWLQLWVRRARVLASSPGARCWLWVCRGCPCCRLQLRHNGRCPCAGSGGGGLWLWRVHLGTRLELQLWSPCCRARGKWLQFWRSHRSSRAYSRGFQLRCSCPRCLGGWPSVCGAHGIGARAACADVRHDVPEPAARDSQSAK